MRILDALVADFGTSWVAPADAVLKATLIFAAAGLVSFCLRRRSAALRHMIWTLALGSVLVLPVLSLALPRWQLNLVTIDGPSAVASSQSPVSSPQIVDSQAPSTRHQPPSIHRSTADSPRIGLTATAPAPASKPISWSTLLVGVWMIGALLILARLAAGVIAVTWMSRSTEIVTAAPWLQQARSLSAELGISPRIVFLRSKGAAMPMAWGVFRPAVLMPSEADAWPAERLRIVLLHELAHVKRRDCLTHMLAQVSCALHWFNPLAWMAARRVRTERERACDDLVLAAGTRGSDYADQLIEIARVMRAGRFPAVLAGASLAMAHRSELEGRLLSILDPSVPRAGLSRLRTSAATTMVALAVMPLASLQPWKLAPAAEPKPVAPLSQASAPVQAPQPAPEPTPAPAPNPRAEHTTEHATPVDAHIESAIQSAVQSGVQSRIQSSIQSSAQSSVQSSIQSGIQTGMQTGIATGVAVGMHAALGQLDLGSIVDSALAGAGMSDRDHANRRSGQSAQGKTDPRTVAALTAALKDSDKDVRETAMHALVQMRDPSIFDPLVQALSDPSPDVREQAAFGLGQLRDRRAVEPLTRALKDQNADVREQAAFALGQLRDGSAVAALNAALKDVDDDVREQAVFALGQIRDPNSVDALVGAVHDSKANVREQAVFALGQLRDRRAVDPLIAALKDSDADVREQAAFALGQVRDPRAVEALVIALKDSASDVREQAAFALGQIRDPRAIDGLTAALKDASADVRQQAAFALGQLAK